MPDVSVIRLFGEDIKMQQLEDGMWHGDCIFREPMHRATLVIDVSSPACTPSELEKCLKNIEDVYATRTKELARLLCDQVRWERYRQDQGFGPPCESPVPILVNEEEVWGILGPVEIEISTYIDSYLRTTFVWSMPWSVSRVLEVTVLHGGELRYGR